MKDLRYISCKCWVIYRYSPPKLLLLEQKKLKALAKGGIFWTSLTLNQNLTTTNLSTFHISVLLPGNFILEPRTCPVLRNPAPPLCNVLCIKWIGSFSFLAGDSFKLNRYKILGRGRACDLGYQQELTGTGLLNCLSPNYIPRFLEFLTSQSSPAGQCFLRSLTNSPIISCPVEVLSQP